ncbi:WYL domain-containing protein [Phascolarctobacterium sp. ET69]|uniref:helix-turn-helix transcriptional regulator n=1 Tax=Phascolarctobacterium sp. ET69 TaxID=2939420 RepID=UPI002012C707|nr:WYL domain-containing protein [Phascolarctobacterium sp. ET69]MCL1605727.1 WYL domain-containing protein [Phascolarctobacterium sp. ET69]
MTTEQKDLKIAKDRLLAMYAQLAEGKPLYKACEAVKYNCSLRSIQRDIEDLRSFFADRSETTGVVQELIYDRKLNAYRLVPPLRNLLTNEETFAVLKVLLESRSLTKVELFPILEKLISCCVPPYNRRQVTDLIANEKYHYVEPRHKKEILEKMWNLSAAIREHKEIKITYMRQSGDDVSRVLKPVGIMFSEFYFYIVGFINEDEQSEKVKFEVENDPFPTIYRIDRIKEYAVTERHFNVPYQNRFEEGEFRKRVQFMYGGKLQKIKFWYKGPSVEAVLDRLPTAKILQYDGSGYLISAEVFGKGINMWLRSQGDMVEVVE